MNSGRSATICSSARHDLKRAKKRITYLGAFELRNDLRVAAIEIGKHLGLPTQAYIGLSDAKQLDAQAGLESSMGATLAVPAEGQTVGEALMASLARWVSLRICQARPRLAWASAKVSKRVTASW